MPALAGNRVERGGLVNSAEVSSEGQAMYKCLRTCGKLAFVTVDRMRARIVLHSRSIAPRSQSTSARSGLGCLHRRRDCEYQRSKSIGIFAVRNRPEVLQSKKRLRNGE